MIFLDRLKEMISRTKSKVSIVLALACFFVGITPALMQSYEINGIMEFLECYFLWGLFTIFSLASAGYVSSKILGADSDDITKYETFIIMSVTTIAICFALILLDRFYSRP